MKSFSTEFKVGLFSIVAAVTTAYMFFVLSPESFESTENQTYYTILSDAAGIIPKTHVKTNGVTIGKVRSVELQVNRTRVEMEVDAKVSIPKGSKVELRTRGLLGDKWIEIIRIEDTGEYLENDGYLPVSEDQMDMQQVFKLMGAIAKDVKQVTNSLAAALGGERGERTVANIIADIQELVDGTNKLVNDNRHDFRDIVKDLKATSKSVRTVLSGNEQSLTQIVENVKGTSEDLQEFAGKIRELVSGDNEEALERILSKFDNTMIDVEKTAKSVALVSDRIEKGEGTIGKLVNDDKLLQELQAAVKDVRNALKPVNKLRIAVDYHGEVNPTKRTAHYFNLVFKTRPDKFYLLGFADAGEQVTLKSVTTENSGDPAIAETTTSQRERKSLRINAQFAKRWYFAQVRLGLFESTGGLAADFYGWKDRLRFTVEAYDWQNKNHNFVERRVARIKTYASILFFNHIYAMIGVDDPTLKYVDSDGTTKERGLDNYFIGAGLTFNDDDLKAVFGAAALAL